MAKFTTTLLCATALIAVAGCAKKRPETLPPAPVDSSAGVDPTGGLANGGANGAIVPGSDADFRRSVQSNTVNFAQLAIRGGTPNRSSASSVRG